MNRKKQGIGFSILDIILVVLILTSILSGIFQEQIHRFFGEGTIPQIQYTFLIQHVTDQSENRPKEGETLYFADTGEILGTIVSIEEEKNTYQNLNNGEEYDFWKLTCRATTEAVETESGYQVNGITLKTYTTISVKTESASFSMVVTMVKPVEQGA